MDNTAIQAIAQLGINAAATLNDCAKAGLVTLPEGYTVESTENLLPGRLRYRGKMHTSSIVDFIAYTKGRFMGDTVPVFIDESDLSATAFFNLGTPDDPGHGDDIAVLRTRPTPPWAALSTIQGNPRTQEQVISFCEDWSECMVFLDADGNEQSAAASIAAIRKITIAETREATIEQRDFGASRSALENIDARGAQALPAFIDFTCIPVLGLPSRSFRLRVGVLTSGGKPQLVLRIKSLEAHEEAIAQDFKAALFAELQTTAQLTIGTFTP